MHNPNDHQNADDEQGPGHIFEVYTLSELVVERLKLLEYEKEFVQLGDSFKPVSKYYFVQSTNVGEQFHLFTSICVWLCRKASIEAMDMPHEFDDPNATITRILDAMKKKGIEVLFPSSKLKSGSGPQCISVLLQLTELAMENSGFIFGILNALEGEFSYKDDGQNQADEAELTLDQFEDEVEMAEDVDEPEAESTVEDVLMRSDREVITAEMQFLKGLLRSNAVDIDQMKEELKRVIPQLKVTVRANLKDWRIHVEQMQKLEDELIKHYTDLKPFLTRTGEEIEHAMERIRIREHHLNEQFDGLLQLYRNRQNELAALTEQYRENSGTLLSRTDTLNALNEEIDQLKQQIEEQGMHNTSGAPVLKIKQALVKMDQDIFVMRVQISTMEQALWQCQLNDRLNNTLVDYVSYTNY